MFERPADCYIWHLMGIFLGSAADYCMLPAAAFLLLIPFGTLDVCAGLTATAICHGGSLLLSMGACDAHDCKN